MRFFLQHDLSLFQHPFFCLTLVLWTDIYIRSLLQCNFFYTVFSSNFLCTMSSLDAPRPQTQPVRRCATLPTKFHFQNQRSLESLRPSVDDVFFHPCAKVVHFAPRALAPIPSSTAPSDFDYPVDTIETLPWRSPTERTVAFAPLRLQNVHGLTVFLKCGGVVHAILKNSQCWCVDGESTFVLRVRPLTYYRIELPQETENNEHYVVELKNTLPKILRYEITPCPFKRGFTVEIPQDAKVPKRKKAWRPKSRRESAPASSTASQSSFEGNEDTRDSSSTKEHADNNTTDTSSFRSRGSASTTLETIQDDNELLGPTDFSEHLTLPRRAVTETPQSFQTLLARFENNPVSRDDPGMSFSSSPESFHSIEGSYKFPEWSARSNSTSPSSVDHAELAPDEHHQSQNSSESIYKNVDYSAESESSDNIWDDNLSQAPPPPAAHFADKPEPRLDIPSSSTSTDKNTSSLSPPSPRERRLSTISAEFRRRAKTSTERELSPMPPPSTLCRTDPSKKSDAKTIIHKTCTVVLVPSVQLLIILIHLAAQIVIGPALNPSVRDANRRLECQGPDSEDAVDDFDLPLECYCSSGSQDVNKPDVWELD